jgi:ferrochelatase
MNGAMLMTYGSPRTLDEAGLADYLRRVRGGREPDDELVTEFTRRYRVIGGSPLVEITRRQAASLESAFGWPAVAAMRFSEPSLEAGLRELADRGVDRVAAIILSPQYSPMLMGGYGRAIAAARAAMGPAAPEAVVAGAWHLEPSFVGALGGRIRSAIDQAERRDGMRPAVLLTAHSLPLRVAREEPGYLAQLEDTANAVADAAGLAADEWTFCWQSAGHEPGEWMKPDFADLMPGFAAAGRRAVLVAPVQFLADHLETLYDIDVGAREQAEANGLRFDRVASLNDAPELARALADVARRTLAGTGNPAGVAI